MKVKIALFLSIILALTYSESIEASDIFLANQEEISRQESLLLKSLELNSTLRQKISAKAYIAVDLSDNSVILKKNINSPYPIASVTKLMNAVIVLENTKKDQTITLTEEMLSPPGKTPTLFSGLNISVDNLLKAALIQSTNDAAESLSYFMGHDRFVWLMNQKAKKLGMKNTIYYDVHGLNIFNRSTASDLGKLVSYINKHHPEIWEITKNNDFYLPNTEGIFLKFLNLNDFYPLDSFVGGKTGYLAQARQTLASVFNINGKPIAITMLSSKNRMADVFNILRQLKDKI